MTDAGTITGRRTSRTAVVRRPDHPTPAAKRSLLAISHAIESAVLHAENHEPTVVVALFQRLAYFEREYAVYERLAGAGIHVVVGFTDGDEHAVPDRVQAVLLDPGEPLADEWTVVAVGPDAGAFLVATDTHEIDPTEYTLEAGRQFDGRWGYSQVQAANELARLRIALGDRIEATTASVIDDLLARVMPAGGAAAASRGTTGEQWATASLQRVTAGMDDARAGSRVLRAQLADAHAAADARAGARLDTESGLPTPDFLDRWAGSDGRAGALPVGIAVLEFADLHGARTRHSRRSTYHAARQAAAAMSEPLGPVDAAVRLSESEFAVVVPGASSPHLQRVASSICEQLELYSSHLPGPSLTARVATTVTLSRPLPFDDLHLALGHPPHAEQTPTTLAGDDIVVASSADLAEEATPETADERAAGRWFRDGRRVPTPTTGPMPHVRVPAAPRVVPDRHDGGTDPSRMDTGELPALAPTGRHGTTGSTGTAGSTGSAGSEAPPVARNGTSLAPEDPAATP